MTINLRYQKFACVIAVALFLVTWQLQSASAQEQIRGEVLEFGIYQFVGEQSTISAPETVAGKATVSEVVFVKTTDQIPLAKGVRFGLKWSATGFPEAGAVELTHILEHPSLKLPSGGNSSISKESYLYKPVNGIIAHTEGYGFSDDYELIEGQYKFTISYKNTPFITKTFTVFKQKSP